MHPADLAQERQHRARKARRQLAIRARHATLNATDNERVDLERLLQLHADGAITTDDAHRAINALLSTQHLRARRAA